MLTIFTTCKQFEGTISIHQRNAICSWRKIFPDADIIIFGNENGTESIANEIGAQRVIELKCGAFGTPYVNEIFSQAQNMTQFARMCYINSDIILTSSFKRMIEIVSNCAGKNKWSNFLTIGQRWDVNFDKEINFGETDWEKKIIFFAKKHGKIHWSSGIDYFFFFHGLFDEIPPFLIARMGWDNWLPWYALRRKGVPLIDGTKIAFIVHLEHSRHRPEEELRWNTSLHQNRLCYCFNATWLVEENECRKLSEKEIKVNREKVEGRYR